MYVRSYARNLPQGGNLFVEKFLCIRLFAPAGQPAKIYIFSRRRLEWLCFVVACLGFLETCPTTGGNRNLILLIHIIQ
jgi:hypothetical protein